MPDNLDFTPEEQEPDGAPTNGIGLCLSGGGYRAMLFHVGTLWRLVDSGALGSITRVSSVSGGSITAAVLALAWDRIHAEGMAAFQNDVVAPLRALAGKTIDKPAITIGIFLPGSIGEYLSEAYAEHLFGDRNLQDLPQSPVFIINATNMETGSLFRFSRDEIRDYRIGRIPAPQTLIADAVAASSAFPPLLSPFKLGVTPDMFDPPLPKEIADDAFRTDICLTDGGVYDNLGLQQILNQCRTIFVSDAGGQLADDAAPPGEWAGQSLRIMDVITQQVRNLRRQQIVGLMERKERQGAFWSVRTDIARYAVVDALPCPHEMTRVLAAVPTRLAAMDEALQMKLINWGYGITDAALRRYWSEGGIAPPTSFPYPDVGVG